MERTEGIKHETKPRKDPGMDFVETTQAAKVGIWYVRLVILPGLIWKGLVKVHVSAVCNPNPLYDVQYFAQTMSAGRAAFSLLYGRLLISRSILLACLDGFPILPFSPDRKLSPPSCSCSSSAYRVVWTNWLLTPV